MKILVDTNLFLDVLFERNGLVRDSQAVLDWCEKHPGDAWIAWHTLANLYYIGARAVGKTAAMNHLDAVLGVFQVCPTDDTTAKAARALPFSDFEDAMQAAAALSVQADIIVTRNTKDFRRSPVKAITPSGFLRRVD